MLSAVLAICEGNPAAVVGSRLDFSAYEFLCLSVDPVRERSISIWPRWFEFLSTLKFPGDAFTNRDKLNYHRTVPSVHCKAFIANNIVFICNMFMWRFFALIGPTNPVGHFRTYNTQSVLLASFLSGSTSSTPPYTLNLGTLLIADLLVSKTPFANTV